MRGSLLVPEVPSDFLQYGETLEFEFRSYNVSKFSFPRISSYDAVFANGDYFDKDKKTQWKNNTLALFGRTRDGFSVCACVKFWECLLLELPKTISEAECASLCEAVNQIRNVQSEILWKHCAFGFHPDLQSKTPQFQKFPFLRVWCKSVQDCNNFKSKNLTDNETLLRLTQVYYSEEYRVSVVESHIPTILHFLEMTSLRPGSVVQLSRPHFYLASQHNRVSHCQVEVTCNYFLGRQEPTFVVKEVEEEEKSAFPWLLTSFDIECVKGNGRGFPDPSCPEDQLICIANTTKNLKTGEMYRVVHSLAGADHHAFHEGNVVSREYVSESALLEGWRDSVVREEDPDIFVGYNTDKFDWWYMNKRAEMFCQSDSRFFCFGKLIRVPCEFTVSKTESRAHGSQEKRTYKDMKGRINMDLYTWMKQSVYKLDNYKLNTVAQKFLGQQKDDMKASDLFKFWLGRDPHQMYLVLKYCLQDTLLPLLLVEKLMILPQLIEMARVTFTFLQDLLSRGQMFKTMSLLFMFARSRDFVLTNGRNWEEEGMVQYQGATVLDIDPGVFKMVAVFDFASLYPSIIRAYNLCYTSYVTDPAYLDLPGYRYFTKKTDIGTFTYQQTLPGLLPQMVESLLSARRETKKALRVAKEANNSALAAILDGRQLALKISCNSIYGFTGAAKVGVYSCPPIAATTTANGRTLIEQTRTFIHQRFSDCKVIAGDTDSVFVHFSGIRDTPEGFRDIFEQGHKMATEINQIFPREIVLEFEKIYLFFINMSKKCYVGSKFENVNDPGSIDAKGYASVRRDFCQFQRQTLQKTVGILVLDKDPDKAIHFLLAQFKALLNGQVPFEDMILTRQLAAEYKNPNQMQLIVNQKIKKRAPGSESVPGERVQFVICDIAGIKETRAFMKVEDAAYAKEQQIPLDLVHYIQAMHPPVNKLFQSFPPKIQNKVHRIFYYFVTMIHNNKIGYMSISKHHNDVHTIDDIPQFNAKKPKLATTSSSSKNTAVQSLSQFFTGISPPTPIKQKKPEPKTKNPQKNTPLKFKKLSTYFKSTK